MHISDLVCTSHLGVNKRGVIPQNADGSYTCIVGGFNCFNNTGEYYELERSKKLYEDSSMLQTMARSRVLKGEYGHPKPTPGQDLSSFLGRATRIEETLVSHCLSRIWLDVKGKDRNGNQVVWVMADVIPCGPYGEALRRDFEQGLVNVCFSVRAFTDPNIWQRERRRVMTRIMTYDYVTLPGIEFATKYDSPTMEGFDKPFAVSDEMVIELVSSVKKMGGAHALSMLSGDTPLVYLDDLRKQLQCDVVKAGSFSHW